MKRRLMHACMILSVVCAAILLCGYFTKSFFLWQVNRSAASPLYVEVWLGEGRCGGLWISAPLGGPAGRFDFKSRWGMPRLSRSLWDFDNHDITLAPAKAARLLAFPIWCLLLPALTLPALWYIRRRPRHQRGFEVDPRVSDEPVSAEARHERASVDPRN